MKLKFILFLVLVLASLLRIYKIGEFPATLYGDEQAFAYNAYSILLTGKDEYGVSFPLQFRSFNDYKAPIPVYILVPSIKLLGLNPFAVRLPVVAAAVITVILTFLLTRLFFGNKISLLASFLLAVSPWHVHLSRGYFEATISLMFFAGGVYFFIKSRSDLLLIIVSQIFFAGAIYSYFTPRILLPVFLVFLLTYSCFFWRREMPFKLWIRNNLLGFIFLVFLSVPLLHATFLGLGLSRLNKLSESMDRTVTESINRERNATNLPLNIRGLFHNKFLVRLRLIKNYYIEHLSPNFWYIYGDNSLRYFTGNMGMFYLLEFPFMIIGLYSLWREKRRAAIFFLGWLLLAPIPATLVGRSFAVRSLAMLPAPFIFVAYGIIKVINIIKNIKVRRIFLICITVFFAVSLGSLLIRYYLEYPVYAATWWGWENKAAIDYAKEREINYNFIFLSDFYTGMPLAFATYNQIHPDIYRFAVENPVTLSDGRHFIQFGKYYIGSLDLDKERLNKGIIPPKSLYIGRPEETESGENINAPDDNRVIYRIYKTN